jgi:DNA-binding FadR family transcriptional regulator
MASIREAVKRLEQLRLVEVRHGDAMRVADWRTAGGLDVVAHLLFRAGGLDRGTLDALMEARALMLSEAASLAAERRTGEQAGELEAVADRIARAPDLTAAQALDWAFFATVVDAAGNLVLGLVMNSIRHIYFQRADLFARVVDDHDALAPLYAQAARAIGSGDAERARDAVRKLADAQAERLR